MHQGYTESGGVIDEPNPLRDLAVKIAHRDVGWEDRLRMALEEANIQVEDIFNILIKDKNPEAPTIRKYKRKPSTVEAVKLTRDNAILVAKWCGGTLMQKIAPTPDGGMDLASSICITSHLGPLWAYEGNYIVRNEDGQFTPKKDYVIEDLYEIIESDEEAV